MEGNSGSGSAILPPKRPPRTPLKLSLASPAPTPPPALSLSRPSSSHSTSSASSGRPSLKLAAISSGLGQLSLSIPQAGPSRYATALNGPQDSDDDERPPGSGYSTSDDDEDGDNAKWGEGDQERMAGELLDVIRGPVGLEDELSGRTRRMRMRSSSRVGAEGSQRPTSSSSRSIEISQKGLFGGDDSLEDEVATPRSARPPPRVDDDALESAVEPVMEVTAATIKDLGRLGEGASGEVRKVMHRPSGVIMAKKTIATSPNPKLHKQHLRELLFMRECSHPAIVQYYGAFLEDNNSQIGICMEYCEAGSLDTLYKKVKAHGWRTGEKVLGKIAESMIDGLVYLHSQKIIHRDIKPSNVLVTLDGQIKLCDFGVSGELVNSYAGTFVGTTFYLSPERIRGGKYSINSDVWSMALTVLEVALNRFPFPSEGEAPLQSPIELLTYLISMGVPKVEDEPQVGIKYTNAFRNFIQVCLDKDPATRPTPQKLVSHGWIRRSAERVPPPDLARWVRDLQ